MPVGAEVDPRNGGKRLTAMLGLSLQDVLSHCGCADHVLIALDFQEISSAFDPTQRRATVTPETLDVLQSLARCEAYSLTIFGKRSVAE